MSDPSKLDVDLYHTYYCRDLSSLFSALDINTSILVLSSNGSRLALSTEKHLVITDDTNNVSGEITLETILEYQHDITGPCTALAYIAQDVVILGFESGDIACFDLNGVGIVEQIFDPAPIRSIQLSHKGLPMDGKYGEIDDRDSFVWILYESAVLAVISVEKLLSENFEDLIKYQLLDNKLCTDFVILPKVYETNKFDLSPEQASHSILVGGEQSTYSIYNLGGPQHFEHFGKFTEYAKSKTINIVSRAFASIFGDSSGAKKTKPSSVVDSSSREGATSPSRDYEYDLVRLPMVAVASVLDFTDQKRKVIRMSMDPTGTYIAISDNLARVSLFDIRLNSIVNLWKGVRDSWVAWSYSKTEGLHLGIYGPRLGLLSTYSIPDGQCTMTAPVGVYKQILTLRVENASSNQDISGIVKMGIVQLPYESELHEDDDRIPVLDILLLDHQTCTTVEGDPESPSKLTRGKFIHDSPEKKSVDGTTENPRDFSQLLMSLGKPGDPSKESIVSELIAATKRVSSASECLKVLSAVQKYELPNAAHVPIEVHRAVGTMLESLSAANNGESLEGTEIVDAIHREAKLHDKLLEIYVLLRELALHRSDAVPDEVSLEQVMDARAGGLREAVGYNLRALKLSTASSRPSFDDGSPRAQRSSGSFSSSVSSTLSSSLHRGDEAWPSNYHHTMARSPLASSLVKSPSFRSGYLPKDSIGNSDEVSVTSRGSSFSSNTASRQGSFSDGFARLELRSNSLLKKVLNPGKMLPDTSSDITFSSFRLFHSISSEGELFVRDEVLQQVLAVLNDRVHTEGKLTSENGRKVVEIDHMAALGGTQRPEFSVQHEVEEAVLLSYAPFLSLPFTCDCSDTATSPEIIKLMISLGLVKGAHTFRFLAAIMPQAMSLFLSSQDFISRVLLPRVQDGNPFCHFLREAILILYQAFEEQLHLLVGNPDEEVHTNDDFDEFEDLPQAIGRLISESKENESSKSMDVASHFDNILCLYLSEMAFSLQQLPNLELAMGICALVSEVLEDVEVEIRNRMRSQFTANDEMMSIFVLTASKRSWRHLFSRLRVNIHLSVRHGKALSLAKIDTERPSDEPMDRCRYPPRRDRASIYEILAEDTLRFALTGVAARAHELKCKDMFSKKHKSSSSWRDAPLKIYGNIVEERSDDLLLLLEADDVREAFKKSTLGDVSPLTKDSTLSPAESNGGDTPSNSGKCRRRRPLLLLFPSHNQSVPLAWHRGLLLCQRWRETMTDTYLLALVPAHLETLNTDLRGLAAFALLQRYLFPIVRGASLLGENCAAEAEGVDSQKLIALLASFSANTSISNSNITTPPTVRLPLKNQGDIFDVMQGALALYAYITKISVPIDTTNRQIFIDRLRFSLYTTSNDVDADDWMWPSRKDPSLETVLDGYVSSEGGVLKDIKRCSDIYMELLLTQHLRYSCHLRGVSASRLLGPEKWGMVCNDIERSNEKLTTTTSEETDTKKIRIEFLKECFSRVNEENSISFIYALGRHWDIDRIALVAEQVYIYVGRGLDADVLTLLAQASAQARGYEPILLSAVLNALRKRIGNTYERLKYSHDNSNLLSNVDKDCLDFVMKVVDVELDDFVRDAIAKKELPAVDIDIASSNSIAMSVYQILQKKVSVTQQSTLEYKKLTTKCNALLILLRSLAKAS